MNRLDEIKAMAEDEINIPVVEVYYLLDLIEKYERREDEHMRQIDKLTKELYKQNPTFDE